MNRRARKKPAKSHVSSEETTEKTNCAMRTRNSRINKCRDKGQTVQSATLDDHRIPNMKPKHDIKYSISSDSDDENTGPGATTNSSTVLQDNGSTSSNICPCPSNNRNIPIHSEQIPFNANDNQNPVNNSDSDLSINPSTWTSINSTNNSDFEKEVADLIAESNRIITECETNVINLTSPRPTREIINLVDSPVVHVVDLTEMPDTIPPPENVRKAPECPICYEQIDNLQMSVTPCGHWFCNNCIKMALADKKICPTCRKKCLPNQLYPLYLC